MCEFCKIWDWGEASAVIELGKYAHVHLACGSTRFKDKEQFNYCPVCGCKNPSHRAGEEGKHETV